MVCLRCEHEIKPTSFECLFEMSPRRICRCCEAVLQPHFKVHDGVLICFLLGEGLESWMSAIHQGDTILIEGLVEVIKRHGFKTFKRHKQYILLKETLEDEMYELLSRKLREDKYEKVRIRLY